MLCSQAKSNVIVLCAVGVKGGSRLLNVIFTISNINPKHPHLFKQLQLESEQMKQLFKPDVLAHNHTRLK